MNNNTYNNNTKKEEEEEQEKITYMKLSIYCNHLFMFDFV